MSTASPCAETLIADRAAFQNTTIEVPVIDLAEPRAASQADADAFMRAGAMVVHNFLTSDELAAWRRDADRLWELAVARTPEPLSGESDEDFLKRISDQEHTFSDDPPGAPDTGYKRHPETGDIVPNIIDLNLDKSAAARRAMAHPYFMGLMELLMGPDFLCVNDPMIVMAAGAGTRVNWHRDAYTPAADDLASPMLAAGIYLDDSCEANSVRVVPGSHRLTNELANELRQELQHDPDGYRRADVVPVTVPAGTLVMHHVHTLHGSPAGRGPLRRTQYFGMRPITIALSKHHDTLIKLCHRRQLACIAERLGHPVTRHEQPYHYRADVSAAVDADPEWQRLPVFRNPPYRYAR